MGWERVDLSEECSCVLNAGVHLSVPFNSRNLLPKVEVKKVKESMGMIRGEEDILGGHRVR